MSDTVEKRTGRSSPACRSFQPFLFGAHSRVLTGSRAPGRDHQPLDFRSAFVNLRDLGVAEKPLDLELLGVAVAAMNLHRLGRGLHRGLSGEQLRHRGFLGARLAASLSVAARMRQQPRRVDLDRHVGELPLNRLVLAIGLPNALALLRVLQRRLERRARDSERLRRDPDPPAVERLHRDLEALPFLGQQVLARHAHIRKTQVARYARREFPSCLRSA